MALRFVNMVDATLPATPAVGVFVAGMSVVHLCAPQPRQVARPGMSDGA